MLAAEYPEFEKLLKKHAQVFSKKLTDEMVDGYWAALKDLSLPTLSRCADSHLRYGKFFPKPIELRPKDDSPAAGVKEDKSFKAAVEQNIRQWDERLRENPIRARRDLLNAYGARTGINELPGSQAYYDRLEFIAHASQKIDAMEADSLREFT